MKRYFDLLFPQKLEEDEAISLVFIPEHEKDHPSTEYVKDFNQYCEQIEKHRYFRNVFNSLATVKVNSDASTQRVTENMYRRSVLYFDLDKKDHPDLHDAYDASNYIQTKISHLFIHAIYDSNHGFHCYVSVETTDQVELLHKLNWDAGEIVGADLRACTITQLARVPCTFNYKESDNIGEYPFVREVLHYQNYENQVANYHPYSLSDIESKVKKARKLFVDSQKDLSENETSTSLYKCDGDLTSCLCTNQVLIEGAEKGERNIFLGRIIFMLIGEGYSEDDILKTCEDWNSRCRPPKREKEVENDVNGYLKKKNLYKLNGCWWAIGDNRVSNIVKKYCDKDHCPRACKKGDEEFDDSTMVRISTKMVSDSRLKKGYKNCLSPYELLVMVVLYKNIKPRVKQAFTVEDLKERLIQKKGGRQKMCMTEATLKKTLEELQGHKCIELIDNPEFEGQKGAFDDTIIKIARGMAIKNDEYIQFYYCVVEAKISKTISGQDFKVFLCIIRNIKEGKSCVENDLALSLGIEPQNVRRAIRNLKKAQCFEVKTRMTSSGRCYNWYIPKYTDQYHIEFPMNCGDNY